MAGLVRRRNLPSVTLPIGPIAGDIKADGKPVSIFCTKQAAWTSSLRTTRVPSPLAPPDAATVIAETMFACPSAPGAAAPRIAPVTTRVGSPGCNTRSSKKAVSSMVSVPCAITTPSTFSCADALMRSATWLICSNVSEAPGTRKGVTTSTVAMSASWGMALIRSSPVSEGAMPPLFCGVMVMVPPRTIILTLGFMSTSFSFNITAPEDQLARQPFKQEIPACSNCCQDHDNRKHAINAKLVLVELNEIPKTFGGANKLADDSADNGECQGRLDARKDHRERVRQRDLAERLQRRCLDRAHQLARFFGNALEPDHRIDEHGEERDDHGHHNLGTHPKAKPGDEERRKDDLGDGLESDHEGIGDALGGWPDSKGNAQNQTD